MKHLKGYKIFEQGEEGTKEISDDKIKEVITDLSKVIEDFNNGKNTIRNHIDDLKSINPKDKEETNDQIDDTIINLEGAEKLIDDVISKYDETNEVLKNYFKEGKQYLYKA